MSGLITPTPVGRQVIPFGDRPLVDLRTGNATFDMYQWMQRITAGFGATITNVSETINQTNINTTDITQIDTDLTGINAEIAEILTTIGMLEGWVQVFLNQTPSPPAPAAPPPARSFPLNVPFPPAPAKWPGAGDFIELESGGVPTKISVMPTATLPLAGTELMPVVPSGANQQIAIADVLNQTGTIVSALTQITFNANGNTSPGADVSLLGADVTTGTSAELDLITGNATSTGITGPLFLGSGNSANHESGLASLGSGTAGTTSGEADLFSGNAPTTGPVNIQSGNASAGNSGNILIQTGTATGSRGEIILDALDLWLDAAGFWSANGAVATALTSVGPTGSHTTVQEWFTVKNASGVTRYIPAF